MRTDQKITVIGLGQMGFTLARLLLKENYRVTVWNRTASKADALIKEGAVLAGSVVDAIQASPTVIICVLDYEASGAILYKKEVTDLLADRTIIQFTTGTPKDAIADEAWAVKYGAHYIDGAIQVNPDQMGRPDTTIFFSGRESSYKKVEPLLKVFGGNLKYFGNRISAASAMDLAALSYFFGSFMGFLHAVRICETEDFDINLLGEIIEEISPGFTEFIRYEAGVIQSGDFTITQSPLAISVGATERIYNASREYKINSDVPKLAADFLKRASDAGLVNQELASLVKVFRN